jgi:hypothetical protein
MNVSECLDKVAKLPRFSRLKIVSRLEDIAQKAEKEAGEQGLRASFEAR